MMLDRNLVIQIVLIYLTLHSSLMWCQEQLEVQGNASIIGYLNIHKPNDSTSLYIGKNAGTFNTRTAGNNAMIGADAGRFGNPGSSSFFGYKAGYLATGSNNAFFGAEAGRETMHGSDNAFFGTYAGVDNLGGEKNAFFGFESGVSNNFGSQNSFFGDFAGGSNKGGSYNTFLGSNAGLAHSLDSLDKSIAIGYAARVGCHNCAVIGGTGPNAVKVGIGTEEPAGYLEIAGDSGLDPHILLKESEDDYARIRFSNSTQPIIHWDIAALTEETGNQKSAQLNFFYNDFGNVLKLFGNGNATLSGNLTENSDRRLKEDLIELNNVLPKIFALSGYNYLWASQPEMGRQIGLVAQEVYTQFPELVHKDLDGVLSVNYSKFVPVLIQGMKEQERRIKQQGAQIQELKSLVGQLMDKQRSNSHSIGGQ